VLFRSLFTTPEELSAGHPTKQEIDSYAAMGKILRDNLQANDIALSLNPWTTIYHEGRGRKLRQGQEFQLIMGEMDKKV